MRRREFIALGIAAAARPLAVRAQQPRRVRRIGYLHPLKESEPIAQLRTGEFEKWLQELGWTKGTNIELHYRWAAGRPELSQTYATELVALQPDVIVCQGAPNAVALAKQTRTIPIVFLFVSDPVGMGLVQSMARPGGNITGFAAFEPSLGGKWLELLKESTPSLTRVGIVFNPKTAPNAPAFVAQSQIAGSAVGVAVVLVHVLDEAGLERAIAEFAQVPGGGLILVPDPFTNARPQLMAGAANRHRLPLISPFGFISTAGGLMAYGIDGSQLSRQAAGYVDRILRGERPADLPIQQPTKFELVINLKTAKALGLTIPQTLLARADEVIE